MALTDNLPRIFYRFTTHLIYMLGVPLFFLSFMLIYRPGRMVQFFDTGRGLFSFNLTMLFCIMLVVMISSRLSLFFARKEFTLTMLRHSIWCIGEIVLCSMFFSLYIYLMYLHKMPYFEVLGQCVPYMFCILVYPYVILIFVFMDLGRKEEAFEQTDRDTVIRFMDNTKKLKFAITASAVYYIVAEENYVRIYYLEGSGMKEYVLRSSMKSLEELVTKHGMVRCQRSFFVNPSHVRVLRRDKEGSIVAELDMPVSKTIPVSKRYYDALASLL